MMDLRCEAPMKYLNRVALKISSLYFLIVGLAIVSMGIITMQASQRAVLMQFENQQQRIVQAIEANINLRINLYAYRLDISPWIPCEQGDAGGRRPKWTSRG